MTPDDTLKVLEELLPAQNKSYELGLALKLSLYEVDSIHKTYKEYQHRLLQIIAQFLKQMDPAPTWRDIINALRSPAVNLSHLARRLEVVHFPDPTKHGVYNMLAVCVCVCVCVVRMHSGAS